MRVGRGGGGGGEIDTSESGGRIGSQCVPRQRFTDHAAGDGPDLWQIRRTGGVVWSRTDTRQKNVNKLSKGLDSIV